MFLSSYHHEIFRRDYQWEKWCPCKRSSQCQRSKFKVKVTKIMTPFSRFRTVTAVWIHIWWWNDPSNFKVTQLKRSLILTQIGRFRTVTLVWIHRWLWNDVQSLKQHRRGALLFFKIIRQISRSHGTINRRFKIMHKAWCNLEQVSYHFRGHPSNFKVTRAEKSRFESNLSKITRPVAAIKSLRVALLGNGLTTGRQCQLLRNKQQ